MKRLTMMLLAGCATAGALAAEEKPAPCTQAGYAQFDFWLGEWVSYDKDGEKQGNNRLHEVMDGCAIQENWTSRGGEYRGTSFNFYDARTDRWHQTWIDNQGGHLFLSGGLVDGSMQLSGDGVNRQGEPIVNRITWTPLKDGRVRQHWQVSSDDGETWEDAFDGYYRPVDP